MSVRITSKEENAYALFDSVSGHAFGEVFATYEEAQDFLIFLDEIGERDPRIIPTLELAELRSEWVKDREEKAVGA